MKTAAVPAVIGLLALGCGQSSNAVVLHNGVVYTANPAGPWAQAVLIEGDRIVMVGSNDSVLAAAPRGTRRIDVGQRVVIPGFNDSHDHIAPMLPALNLVLSDSPIPDPSGNTVRDSIAAAARRTPAGRRIRVEVGELVLSDPRIRRDLLDVIAPAHPVEIRAWSGHGIILNSAALAAAGITDTTPDPWGGWLERTSTGRLTGLLEEYADFNALAALSPRTDSAAIAAFTQRGAAAIRWGVTSIQNMTLGNDDEMMTRIVPKLALPIRLRLIRFPLTTATGVARRPLQSVAATPGITVSGTKWIVDGTPVERGAALRAPYSDRAGWYGRINFPADTLRVLLEEAVRANEQPHLHAVGDSAIALVLSLLETVAPDSVWRALRPRIEHGEGLTPDQMGLAKRFGVILVQNPTHFALGPSMIRRYGSDRMAVVQPARSALANGVAFAFGSDGPANPFLNILLATSHPNNPKEALSVEQAISAYTAGSAFAEHREKEKGMLAAGLLADLAVLSQDIFSVPRVELPRTVSLLTVVGGRPVRDSLGWWGGR